MRKIYDFSKFSSIYEAETSSSELNVTETEASKLYDQTLGLILTTILNSYGSELTFPVNSYDDNIDSDIISVKNTPILNKPAEMVKILQKVQKSAADNNLEGAKEALDAWVSAGSKATEALTAMINQYENQPEELTHINNFINAKLDSFLEEIETASQENDLKAEIESSNESVSYEGEIFEGIFQGKKGLIGDVSRQITLVNAKLASLAQTPGMASAIQSLQNEVTQISAKMGDLLGKSNKDINKEDIKKAAARLAEIPGEADKIAEKMLKEDSINKEASSILVQALALVQVAIEKEKKYLQKKEKAIQAETESAAKAAEKAREDKVKVKVSDYIEFDKSSSGKANDEVAKVQQLIIDKFGDIEEIKDLPQYKEFSRFGADGKFGTRTQEMIKIIQRGLDMDPSGNISPDLVYRIQTEDVVNESARQIFKFKEFDSILESFKIKNAVEYAKKRPTYNRSTSGGGSKGSGSSGGGSSSKISDKEIAENAKKNQEFLKLSAEEKWKWLLNYIKNSPRVSSYRERKDNYGNPILSIVWKSSGEDKYTIDDKEVYTWCWKPENNNSLGRYEDYTSTGKDWFIKYQGNWGEQVDPSRTNSNSGNWTDNGKVNIKDVDWDQMKDIAAKIAGATVDESGTSEETVLAEIKKIKTKEEFRAFDSELEDLIGHDFQWIINDEYGVENAGDVKEIADWLNKIGVKTTYKTAGGGRDFWAGTFKTSY